jgi:hypothetical protein
MENARVPFTRRDWLTATGLAAGAFSTAHAQTSASGPAGAAPSGPVAIAKVASYDEDLVTQFRKMFDQVGGIQGQVQGKTVAIKVNLSGGNRFEGYTPGDTHWVHPKVVGAVTAVLGQLGAKRIRILESAGGRRPDAKLEDKLLQGGWDVAAIRNAAPLVEFEDTNGLGLGKQYSTFKVKTKPYVFPAFQLNHSYEDCDFFVSLGKAKNHEEMGVTMSIKNMFGVTPTALYGGRERIFHYGQVQAPSGGNGPAIQPLRGVASSAHSGGHHRGTADRPGDQRCDHLDCRRRGSVGVRRPSHQAGSARGRAELRQHRCGDHGYHGLQSTGRQAGSSVPSLQSAGKPSQRAIDSARRDVPIR